MSLRWLIGLAFIGIWALAGGPAEATGFEPSQAIADAIRTAALDQIGTAPGTRLEIDVGEIDPRIHLPLCDRLAVTVPRIVAPALTARVACGAPAWTLYVPLQLHAWGEAVVAATNLAPDTRLSAADLTLARVDVLATNGAYLTDPAQAEGKILRTNIRAGAPIPAAVLDQPVIIRRGQTVVLTVEDAAITIRTNVVALQDGRVGDSILVENPESSRDVRATVSGAGAVVLRFDASPEVN